MSTIYPFARPLYVMSKAAGPACNLRCEYCYYLEKQHLLGERQPVMTDELLEVFVRDYIQLQQTPDILFTWHGGEPMLRPLDFYRKAVRLQRYYGRGKRISNVIQTNGTLLTDEWCEFLHDEGWLVGISIDGTKGYAIVEGSEAYEVEFEYRNGEISQLICSCFCSYNCKHEFAAMLQLRETLELIEKNYGDEYERTGYFAAVNKGTLFAFTIDGKDNGSFTL